MAATHGPNDLAIRRETGARIRARRTALGLTQTALADACGTDVSQISSFETGKRRISLDWLSLLAHALDVKASELLPEHMKAPTVHGDAAELVAMFDGLTEAGREQFLNLARGYAAPLSTGGPTARPAPAGGLVVRVARFADLRVTAPEGNAA